MKTLTIKRIAEIEDGTFGVILDGDTPFAVTLERNWLDNQANVSCIPAGIQETFAWLSSQFLSRVTAKGVSPSRITPNVPSSISAIRLIVRVFILYLLDIYRV